MDPLRFDGLVRRRFAATGRRSLVRGLMVALGVIAFAPGLEHPRAGAKKKAETQAPLQGERSQVREEMRARTLLPRPTV